MIVKLVLLACCIHGVHIISTVKVRKSCYVIVTDLINLFPSCVPSVLTYVINLKFVFERLRYSCNQRTALALHLVIKY